MVFVFVGLGNPSNAYSHTRHNVGFMAVDTIVDCHNFPPFQQKYKGEIATATICMHKVIVVKPQTFMNKSGECVSQVVNFYKVPPKNVIVFYDDLDLPIGKVRVKIGGGNGGHNGLRSMDSYVDKNYVRVRIGIDHPGDKNQVSTYVLGKFTPDETQIIDSVTQDIADYVDLLIDNNVGEFMNKLALKRQNNKGNIYGI